MAQSSCPITARFLTQFRSSIEDQEDLLLLLGDLEDDRHQYLPPSVLLLRAFYVTEALYHIALPAVCAPPWSATRSIRGAKSIDLLASVTQSARRIQLWRFDRSYAGMTELLHELQKLQEELDVNNIATALDRNMDSGIALLREKKQPISEEVLKAVSNSAYDVRHALGSDVTVRWPSFGGYLFTGFKLASIAADVQIEHAKMLLRTNTECVIHPWDKEAVWNLRSYPVSHFM